MLSNDRFQANRFENKYVVDERLALAIRDHARAHLVPDRYMVASQPNGYAVHSVYLDSTSMALCKATIDEDTEGWVYYDGKRASNVNYGDGGVAHASCYTAEQERKRLTA